MPNDGLPDTMVLTVVAFVILLVGVSILSSVAGITVDSASVDNGERIKTSQTLDGSGSWHRLNDKTGIDEVVVNSRGYAVNLTGASDSYVQSDSNINIGSDKNWTVATWAWVDQDATATNMTALSVNGRVAIRYNQTTSDWIIWYYDDGSGSSYELSLDAPDQPSNFTHLTVVQNATHIKAYRNNTQSVTQNLSQASVVNAPVNSTNWNGRLEETRTFDRNLSDSERQALVDSPIGPQPSFNRTSRIMYDEPYASQQLILFSTASLDTSNVTFSSGFAGQEVDSQNYTWDASGPKIKIDPVTEYPVVYVDYTLRELGPGALLGPVGAAIVLAGIIPILLILGYVLTELGGLRATR